MKQYLNRYKYFIAVLLCNLLPLVMYPSLGSRSLGISLNSFVEMILFIPPIFVLLGLFDIWVPRETILKLMGERSGMLGTSLALFLGSFAAGPLYAAFPVAKVLIAKGCRLTNVLVFVCAWATTKVPMLLFEASSMGWPFMLTRLTINLPGIILIAYLANLLIPGNDKDMICQNTGAS